MRIFGVTTKNITMRKVFRDLNILILMIKQFLNYLIIFVLSIFFIKTLN